MPYISIIEPEEAEGRLKEIYEELREKRGKLAHVHKIQSLNPESIVTHMEFYLSVMFGRSPLSRAQREMLGVVVSSSNNCPYCVQHHSEALNHYWKDERRVQALARDFESLDLEPADRQLCRLARKLTLRPDGIKKDPDISSLTDLGLSERAVLDAVLVTGYFNFVNRLVLGLGVEPGEEEVGGYKY
ncbi:MAG: peroxidase-related enzyme [Balneolaceae bacterium]|nr:peroxidase-related enzyme [Balneolaceae bacterium]